MEDIDKNLMKSIASPVEKLIDVLARGAGVLYEPTHVVRMAKANAKAKSIDYKSETELDRLEHRAEERMASLDNRRQVNIEGVVAKALNKLDGSEEIQDPDSDWLVAFFESCQDISNEELQNLWAHILVDETTKSGSYSVRTLNFLRYVSKEDAKIFNKIASYIVQVDDFPCLLWEKHPRSHYGENGFSIKDLHSLRRAGFFSAKEEYTIRRDEEPIIKYFDHVISFKSDGSSLLSILLLSPEGEDLLHLIHKTYHQNFLKAILITFKPKKRLSVYIDGHRYGPNDKTEDVLELLNDEKA